jgi:hypothetical protein
MRIIATLIGIAGLICFVMVLIRQFQTAGAVHGIIGIITCGIWTFIWGWMNANNLNIKNIMIIWTLLWVACLAINLMFGTYSAVMPPTNVS